MKPKSYIQGVIARFNALPLIEKIKAQLNAVEFFRGGDAEARGRAMKELNRLRAQMTAQEAPGVPHVRLGKDEEYAGTTISGIPIVIRHESLSPEEEAREIASESAFQDAKRFVLLHDESKLKSAARHAAALQANEEKPVAHPIDPHSTGLHIEDGFVAMKCSRCGRGYETRNPTVRTTCDACTGQLKP